MTYEDVCTVPNNTISDDDRFIGIKYKNNSKKPPENVCFVSLPGYYAMSQALYVIKKD